MSAYTFSPYTEGPDQTRQAYQTIGIQTSQAGVPSTANIDNSGNTGTNITIDSGPVNDKTLTTLNIRYDYLAALAYLLGSISAVLCLIFEHRNDYVRFHAWQASILGVLVFVIPCPKFIYIQLFWCRLHWLL